jgi:hypothetical protein
VRIHSWASFESHEKGFVVPRWQPEHCTLHKILDRIAQDFFPGRKVFLDTENSRLISTFVFNEVDDLSTLICTTQIKLEEHKEDVKGFQAMSIHQQLDALKGWLNICGKELARDSEQPHDDNENPAEVNEDPHTWCREAKFHAIPAKRVLDLACAEKGIVRIVETAGRIGRYAALSHCWGSPKRHPTKTTSATLDDHMSGIAISSLPRSFSDAIKVCLYLDIEYLWIDCLCIVQDNR